MDESKRSLLSRIGLGRRSGKVVFGTDPVCDCVRGGNALLVLVCADTSENTKKRIGNCASYYKVRLKDLDGITAKELGAAIGKGAVSCIAVTDENIVKLIEGTNR